MFDFYSNTLAVGDEVTFVAPHYKHLNTGTILKLNEKTATIEYKSLVHDRTLGTTMQNAIPYRNIVKRF